MVPPMKRGKLPALRRTQRACRGDRGSVVVKKLPGSQDLYALVWVGDFEIMFLVSRHQIIGLGFDCTSQIDIVGWVWRQDFQSEFPHSLFTGCLE